MIASFMILVFVFQRFRFAFAFSVTHILTHNRKNGGGDNGHKTAGWNENPSGKRCKASESPGRAYRLPLITRGIFAEARPVDEEARRKWRSGQTRAALQAAQRFWAPQEGKAATPQRCFTSFSRNHVVQPKKILHRKTPIPQRFRGFFVPQLRGANKKIFFFARRT